MRAHGRIVAIVLCTWVMVRPPAPEADSSRLGRLWHQVRHGNGIVAVEEFSTKEECEIAVRVEQNRASAAMKSDYVGRAFLRAECLSSDMLRTLTEGFWSSKRVMWEPLY